MTQQLVLHRRVGLRLYLGEGHTAEASASKELRNNSQRFCSEVGASLTEAELRVEASSVITPCISILPCLRHSQLLALALHKTSFCRLVNPYEF